MDTQYDSQTTEHATIATASANPRARWRQRHRRPTASEPVTPAAPPRHRYYEPRRLIQWNGNDLLRVLKMLAWVLFMCESIRNPAQLERRIDCLCEPVMRAVLGEADVTLASVKAHTLLKQGAEITAHKLLQRADKADRYDELNEFAKPVLDAYMEPRARSGAC